MIRKLRHRFILIVLEAFGAVLLLTLVSINLIHLNSVYDSLDERLDYLAQSGLGPNRGMLAALPDHIQDWVGQEAEGVMQADHYFIFQSGMRADQYYNELYDLSAATGRDAAVFLAEALAGDRDRGNFGAYRYYVESQDLSEYKVVLLNAENEFFSIRTLLKSSLLVGTLIMLLVMLLVMLLSRQAVQPFVENIERQKRFITDASHSIKTPLGIIAADVDMLSMEHGDSEWTHSARGQIDRLAGLADGLVILSRLEENLQDREDILFSPAMKIREQLEVFEPLIREKGLTVDAELLFSGSITGDGTAFEHLAQILIENAVKYSPEEKTVHILLRRERRLCLFQVSNDCQDPEEIDTEKLFDRFYRTDSARAQSPGHGIGLSIARNVADRQGWKLTARQQRDQITFTAEIGG